VIATADYYSEPLYVPVVVEMIHENRDERDRLHNELRRLLFPLRRKLLGMDPLIRRVRVDSEKQDMPLDEAPYVLYVSLFTVHTYFEMLEAANVTGADGTIASDRPDGHSAGHRRLPTRSARGNESMSRQKQQEANAEAVFDGATFESMSGGPTKIVLAGMFHADPSLIEADADRGRVDRRHRAVPRRDRLTRRTLRDA
jgi:hypothetical protein